MTKRLFKRLGGGPGLALYVGVLNTVQTVVLILILLSR